VPTPADVVIALSASGTTPYTLAAARVAAGAGALTIGIASNAGSPLLAAVAHPILLDTGAEVIAGSTRMKAGTAQKVALNVISTGVMIRLGYVYRGLMVEMRPTNAKLRERSVRMVMELTGADEATVRATLAQAGGVIKLATVMLLLKLDRTGGEAALERAGGNLRKALA